MKRQLPGLVLALSLLCGCAHQEYHPEQNGYGFEMTYPVLPDSASKCRLVYDGGAGSYGRQTVWPEMMSGYYGNSVIEGDLIVFGARRPGWGHVEGIPVVLAARHGAAAVEITRAALRAASIAETSSAELQDASVERTPSGVRIRFVKPDGEATFSWAQIDELVTRLRATGKSRSYHFIQYIAEH